MERYGLFIDGAECESASGERMPVIYPYTGQPFAEISVAAPADVERAVAAAERAFREYLRGMPAHERARLLMRTAETIAAHREEHGSFREVEELLAVHGIGPAKLNNLRPYIHAGSAGSTPPASPLPAERKPGKKEESLSEPINVSQASLTELQRLPGIGPKMSQRIVDERRKAPFRTVDDLRRVPGIGPKTLEKLRPFVTVGGGELRVATVDD